MTIQIIKREIEVPILQEIQVEKVKLVISTKILKSRDKRRRTPRFLKVSSFPWLRKIMRMKESRVNKSSHRTICPMRNIYKYLF